jgi:hypothetical protein
MVLELTLGNVVTLLIAVVGAIWALIKVLGVQAEKRLDERFATLGKALTDITAIQDRNAASVLELEREFRRHQAEAARDFVRRDDFVRHIGVIEVRIDSFALRMERALDNLAATARNGGASNA